MLMGTYWLAHSKTPEKRDAHSGYSAVYTQLGSSLASDEEK